MIRLHIAPHRMDIDVKFNTTNGNLENILTTKHNKNTHQLLRQLGTFPKRLISHINNGEQERTAEISGLGAFQIQEVIDSLDEQGVHSVKTFLMVEYARCKQMPGDAVIKLFDGKTFTEDITEDQEEIVRAVKR